MPRIISPLHFFQHPNVFFLDIVMAMHSLLRQHGLLDLWRGKQ